MLGWIFRIILKALRHSWRCQRNLSLNYVINGTQRDAEGNPVLVLFTCVNCGTTLAVRY